MLPVVAAKPKAELQRDAERTRAELLVVATEVFAESGIRAPASTRSPSAPGPPSG